MNLWNRLKGAFVSSHSERWVDIGNEEDFPPETVRRIPVRDIPIAVFRTSEGFHAIGDVCPHMGASLSDGILRSDGTVQCSAHEMRFSLASGKCVENHPYVVRVFPLRVRDGRVLIRI